MKKFLLLFIVLLALGWQAALAQSRTVKGKVVDETGLGYPGAGVSVKGTQIGTVTDVNGNFSLDVPTANNVLVIQAVGYQTQEYTISGGGAINIRLRTASNQLQGAVVTALGVRREKRDLGYSSTTVSSEDLTAGNNTSAISALQGKVAGANITSSTGGPGGSTRIVLRGEKSITRNNNALIVVDGIIINNNDRLSSNGNPSDNTFTPLTQVDFGNSANDIDPDDIESVTVLEGPAAAALYGSIGANGAIMITTKSGKSRTSNKKLEVTYKATYTQSDILKYPDFQHEFGQGNIYEGIPDDRRENFSWGEKFDGQLRPWGQIINGKQLVKPYSDQPDNVKSFFNHGKDLNNYVSLAGGDDKTVFFLSLNSLNSTGVIPNTFYNKYSVRFNGSTELSNNFYASINVNYLNTYSRVEATGQNTGSVYDNLFETARDIPVWELKNNNPNDPKSIYYSMGTVDSSGVSRYGYYGAYYKNPYWVADNYDNRNRTDRVLGDVTIGYKKGKWNVYDRAGGDASGDRSTFLTPKYNFQPYEVDFYGGDNFISQGGVTLNNVNYESFYNDLIADYKTDLSENVGLDVLVGNNIRYSEARSTFDEIDPATNGLVVPNYYSIQNNQGPIISIDNITQTARIGMYGDIKLNYKRALFLEMTGRNDWTSTLSPGNRSYFYPSVNGSWVFTEGMKPNNILSYGKIRGGYASVGNDAPAYYNNPPGYLKSTVATGFGSVIFPFNGQPGFQVQNTIGYNTLRPERTNEYEVGTDLSFLRDRVNVSFTYYNDLTVDQIVPVPLAASTGYAFRVINLGDVKNSGEEVTLRITPLNTKTGFKWDLFGTYTHNVSEVVRLPDGVSQITLSGFNGMSIVAAVGRPYGAFYGIDVLRDPQGHVVVDPGTGLPLATSNTVYKGTFQPRFIASWGTDLSYKGFSLHVLFTTKQGGVFFSRNKSDLDFNGTSAETAYNNRNPYVWAGSVNQVVNPTTGATTYVTNTTKFSPYEYYVNVASNVPATEIVDASYVKLQEAALYYTIPQSLYKRSPFGTIQAGVFGNNLLIWTAASNKYDDPEETSSGSAGNGQGFNYTARPSLRNYGVSLKVTF